MKRLLFLVVSAIACMGVTAQTPPISIPVVNQDFEAQNVTGGTPINDPPGCGTVQQGQITGWIAEHVIDGSGFGVAHWTCDDGMPNSNVAFLASGALDQLLAENPHFGVYVLQFDVASWFYSYSGDWLAALYMGNSPAPFCSASGWSLGDMKRITVTCPLHGGYINPANAADALSVAGQISGNIRIHFQNGGANPALGGHAGWPILIDNVSLTFTPTN